MPIVIFRSICCGVAATVVALFVWMWGDAIVTGFAQARSQPSAGVYVGWDLVSLVHKPPLPLVLVAVLGFSVGFALGLRSFSRPSQPS